MEQKKKLIILGTLIVIFVVLALCFWPKPKKENNIGKISTRKMENTYTMYIRINPLVKLIYKETYDMCKKENGLEYACSPKKNTVSDYKLLNDDAKNFYQDTAFKGKDLIEVLANICDIARDKNVAFSSFEIISDNLNLDTKELQKNIKDKSQYATEYEIYIQFEEYLNEDEIIANNITKFKVTFDLGDNNIGNQTVLVKANEFVIEPPVPIKEGYIFVEWQNNAQKFDFTSSINQDITLKAVWKKNPITTTTKKEDTTTKKKTTLSKKTTPTKKPSNITSTIDKINLNDNILVYEREFGIYKICVPRYIIFASSIVDDLSLFKDPNSNNYQLDKAIDETKCPTYEEDADKRSECLESQCAKLKETLDLGIANLNYDTSAEEKANASLNELKEQKTPGIADFTYTTSNHKYTYVYKALLLDSNQVLDDFGVAYNKRYNSFENEIKNIFKKGTIVDETCNGACGIGPGNTVTLTLDLCNKYNLTCDRW